MRPVGVSQVVEIEQLLHRYCHVVDDREWDRLGELFLADAVFDVSAVGLPRHQGRDDIVAAWTGYDHPLAHHVLCTVVDGEDDDGVHVRSKSILVRDGKMTGGAYLDVVCATEHGWQFRSRTYVERWAVVVGGC